MFVGAAWQDEAVQCSPGEHRNEHLRVAVRSVLNSSWRPSLQTPFTRGNIFTTRTVSYVASRAGTTYGLKAVLEEPKELIASKVVTTKTVFRNHQCPQGGWGNLEQNGSQLRTTGVDDGQNLRQECCREKRKE